MVFSSLTFLCFFFPLCVLAYFICKNRVYRNIVLLVFSLFFYSWGEPKYIILMLAASLIAYFGGIIMHKLSESKWEKTVFVLTVSLLLLNLIVFKYLNFIVDSLNVIPGLNFQIKEILLPIGISFYTFQILSYVIDLHRGEIALQKNPFYLILYVSFFPQLIAGPIVRYQTIEEEITNRRETLSDFTQGVKRFIVGLAKKVIIANNVAKLATIVYGSMSTTSAEDFGTSIYWIAALSYTMQIYFDFSGYSDMAIGMGRMFGFHFLENFNYPYVSKSITEFWRRWHISLSQWFRDYVYIPLGGNRTSKIKWIRNILIVWGLTGLWHGASWNFVIWGIYFAAFLLFEKLIFNRLLNKMPAIVRWLYTFIVINVSWVIFNLVDFEQMIYALKTMFIYAPTDYIGILSYDSSIINSAVYIPIAFLFSFPIFKKLEEKKKIPDCISNIGYAAVFVLCMVYIISSTFNPFIYFRF